MKSHVKFMLLAMLVTQAFLANSLENTSAAENLSLSSSIFDMYAPIMDNGVDHTLDFVMSELNPMHPTVQSHTY